MTYKELKAAIKIKRELIWNDPQPIEGNDYTISYMMYIENDEQDLDPLSPILIQYNNGGSEAQVFLHEINYK